MLSLGVSYTFTNGGFDSGKSDVSPKWQEGIVQADYRLSRSTDIYVDTLYQTVSGGNGIAAFNAAMFNVPASANNHQLLLVTGLRHVF